MSLHSWPGRWSVALSSNKPMRSNILLLLLIFAGLLLPSAGFSAPAPVIMPATIATGSPSWWAGFTAVSNATGAQVSKGVTASLLSSLGAANSLPATIATTVPRATLASGAAAILKRSPYGLAALALYPLVSSYLSSDGQTLTQQGEPTTPTGIGFCHFSLGAASSYAQCYSAAQAGINGFYGFVWSASIGKYYACGYSCFIGWAPPSSGQCTAPAIWNSTTGQCVPSSQVSNPTESQIATAIQNSSTPSIDLLVAEMNDILANRGGNIDFGTEVIPKTLPASISASPVTTPQETTEVATAPNPDGSTTTTTKKQQVTATPAPKGSTVGDIGVDWQTATTTTSIAHNNATGAETTTTTTTNDGTTTTKAPSNFDCPSCAQETTLQSLKAGTANTLTPKTLKSFDNTVAEEAIADSKAAYDAKFQQVKTELANLFSLTASTNNELPEFGFGTIHGQSIHSSLNNHATALSYVGMTLIFAATVFSIWLLLG